MVVAKTDRAHQALAAQFADHGRTGPAAARLSGLRLGRARPARRAPSTSRSTATRMRRDKMAVRAGGREAVTHWQVLERYPGADGKAGRQPDRLPAGNRPHPPDPGPSGPYRPSAAGRCGLRPGLQDQGRPGCARRRARRWQALGRQALHAYLLAIEHPITGESLEFRSELPADLARLRPQPWCTGPSGLTAKSIRKSKTWQVLRRGSRLT